VTRGDAGHVLIPIFTRLTAQRGKYPTSVAVAVNGPGDLTATTLHDFYDKDNRTVETNRLG
jgi:hypothetical protein